MLNQQNPDVPNNTSLGTATSYAMPVQDEMPCCVCTGIPQGPTVTLHSNVQIMLRRQQGNWVRSLFSHRENCMHWTLFWSPKDLKAQCLQKAWLLVGSSGHMHPSSLSFWWHNVPSPSGTVLNWKAGENLTLIKPTIYYHNLFYFIMILSLSLPTREQSLSSAYLLFMAIFLDWHLFDFHCWPVIQMCDYWNRKKTPGLGFAHSNPCVTFPSLVTPEYLIASFGQPVWKALKQQIQQHLKNKTKQQQNQHTQHNKRQGLGRDAEPNRSVPKIKKNKMQSNKCFFAINNNVDVYCAWPHTLERRLCCPPPRAGWLHSSVPWLRCSWKCPRMALCWFSPVQGPGVAAKRSAIEFVHSGRTLDRKEGSSHSFWSYCLTTRLRQSNSSVARQWAPAPASSGGPGGGG